MIIERNVVIDKSQLATSMFFTKYFSDIQMHGNDKLQSAVFIQFLCFYTDLILLSCVPYTAFLWSRGLQKEKARNLLILNCNLSEIH